MKTRAVALWVAALAAAVLIPAAVEAQPFWLQYDNGNSYAGNSSDWQGVHFTLPAGVNAAQLLTIEIRTTSGGDITFYLTRDDHETPLLDPFGFFLSTYQLQELDVSAMGIHVPHDFFIIVDTTIGVTPAMDDSGNVGRSFGGASLAEMTTVPLTWNLMIRAELEPAIFADGFEDGTKDAWGP